MVNVGKYTMNLWVMKQELLVTLETQATNADIMSFGGDSESTSSPVELRP